MKMWGAPSIFKNSSTQSLKPVTNTRKTSAMRLPAALNPEKSASFFANYWRRAQEERGMQSVVGIALLVVGVVLIIFGMQASASLGSRLSELFTGTPSDRTIWLVVLGVVAAIVGLGLLLVGRRSTL
jgi:TRAP-type uncharacterized transport system fused permease subunit